MPAPAAPRHIWKRSFFFFILYSKLRQNFILMRKAVEEFSARRISTPAKGTRYPIKA